MSHDDAVYCLASRHDLTFRVPLEESQKRHIMGRGSVQDRNIPGKLELGVPSSEAGISRFQAMIRTQVGPEKKVTIRTSDKAKNPTRVVRDKGKTILYLKAGEQSVLVVGDFIELDSYNYTSDYSYVLRYANDANSDDEEDFGDDDDVSPADEERKEEEPAIIPQPQPDVRRQPSSSGIAGLFGFLMPSSSEREEQPVEPSRRSSAPTLFRSIFGGEEGAMEPKDDAPVAPTTQQPQQQQPSQQSRKKDKGRRRKSEGDSRTSAAAEDPSHAGATHTVNPEKIKALTEFLKAANLAAFTLRLIENGIDSVEKLCDHDFLSDDEQLEAYGFKKAQIIKLRRAATNRQQR